MITVFGLGFTGITTALYFAQRHNLTVYGIDIDAEKEKVISDGQIPFYEPKLQGILENHLNKNFFVSQNIKEAINNCKFIFITVGTSMQEDGSADLLGILAVLDTVFENLDSSDFRTIIIKSSVPPTTTQKVIIPYIESKGLKVGEDIGLCINPEFLREGRCYDEIANPTRIVLGTEDEKSRANMNELYYETGISIFNVNYMTAEFSKYLSNSFLASLISFSNEMAIVADHLGDINVKDAFNILKNDNRWNGCEMRNYVHPVGKYGGYCLPKDTNALYYVAKENGFEPQILKDAIKINAELEQYFCDKILNEVHLNAKIGILGLAFKPNSDDVRNTSSYFVIKKLKENNYNNILAYDPIAINNFKKTYTDLDVRYVDDYQEIINQADVLIVLTIWDEFKNIKAITDKKIIDFTHKI